MQYKTKKNTQNTHR